MQVSISVSLIDPVIRGIRRAERRFVDAFEVGRFAAATHAMVLAVPRTPFQTGFLRATAYAMKTGRIGFSALYASVAHELGRFEGTRGPFFLSKTLSEQRVAIGLRWGVGTAKAFKAGTRLENVAGQFPETPPPGNKPPHPRRRGRARLQTRSRRIKSAS